MAGNLQFLILQRLVAAYPLINDLISGSVDEEDAKRSFAEARSQTEFGNEEPEASLGTRRFGRPVPPSAPSPFSHWQRFPGRAAGQAVKSCDANPRSVPTPSGRSSILGPRARW